MNKIVTLFLIIGLIIASSGWVMAYDQKNLLIDAVEKQKVDIEEKSTEITKLENVIEKQNEKIEIKKMVIEEKEEEIKVILEKLKKEKEKPKLTSSLSTSRGSLQKINVVATAYTARCKGCSGITKGGTDVRNTVYHPSGYRVIAVDPRVIPLGSIVEINGEKFISDDIGGLIKGNKIDILVKTYDEAVRWGRQNISVTILRRG